MLDIARLLGQPAPASLRVAKGYRDMVAAVCGTPLSPAMEAMRRTIGTPVPLSVFLSPGPRLPERLAYDSMAICKRQSRQAASVTVETEVNFDLSCLKRDERKALAEALLASIADDAPAV